MRTDSGRSPAVGALSEDEHSVVVEGLGRRYATSRSAYAPPSTIWSRFLKGGGSAGGDDDDDDDDDEVSELEPDEVLDHWALRDVTFALRPGDALAVVGGSGSGAEVLMRVLSGMLPPTAGRARLLGRVTPTIELATALTRIDASPTYHARLLATAARVPRPGRARWIEEVSAFAGVTDEGRLTKADRKLIGWRLAVAAALDPTADVLLVDDVPALGDPAFRERCLARLGSALDRGATAIVAGTEPTLMLELCREAILMTEGRLDRWGTPADLIDEQRRRSKSDPAGSVYRDRESALAGFNEDAAILSVHSSDDELRTTLVRVELETAFPNTELAVSLGLRPLDAPADQAVVVHHSPSVSCPEPGRYVVTAALHSDARTVAAAALEVVVSVQSRGLQTEIGRLEAIDAACILGDLQATWEVGGLQRPK